MPHMMQTHMTFAKIVDCHVRNVKIHSSNKNTFVPMNEMRWKTFNFKLVNLVDFILIGR